MVKAYTINRFYVCEITGSTRVEETLQMGETPQVNILDFSNRTNAINYLRKHERDWFFFVLENWINHKINIYRSNGDNSKLLLAETMRDVINNDLQSKKLSTGAARILAGKDKFKLLIPHENNPSHKSSTEDLNEILTYCEKAKNYDY